MGVIRILVLFLRGVLRNRTELAAENLALLQQLAVLQQTLNGPAGDVQPTRLDVGRHSPSKTALGC